MCSLSALSFVVVSVVAQRPAALGSGSSSCKVFTELCFAVGVVSRSSPRPRKRASPQGGSATDRNTRSHTSVEQAACRSLRFMSRGPTGHEGRAARFILASWRNSQSSNAFVACLLKVKTTWIPRDAGQVGLHSNFHLLLLKFHLNYQKH